MSFFIEKVMTEPVYYFATVAVVAASVTLHELGHAVMAYTQGDDTAKAQGRFTLNPITHMGASSIFFLLLFGICWGLTPVNPNKFKYRYSDVLVSFAGPLTNLLLMILAILLARYWVQDDFAQWILFLVALYNAVLFIFNMLPFPPLDGATVLGGLFPPYQKLMTSLGGSASIFFLLFLMFGSPYLFKAAQFLLGLVMVVL